MNICRRKSE